MLFKGTKLILAICLVVTLSVSPLVHAQDGQRGLISESYYRVKWGYFDEFMTLFKKNHYPILKELKRLGLIESIVVDYPINHAGEQDRWDVRVTTTIPDTTKFKLALARVTQELYPDQKQLKKDEQERFRMVLAHQDIMIRRADLSSW